MRQLEAWGPVTDGDGDGLPVLSHCQPECQAATGQAACKSMMMIMPSSGILTTLTRISILVYQSIYKYMMVYT